VNLFERIMLWGSSLAVGVSGIVYAWMKYFMTSPDPYAVVHHPWQPFVLKLHIVSAPVLVFAVGLVFTRHIWKQWRSGLAAGRASGLSIVLTVVPMVLSGYLIQTVTQENWLFWLVAVHLTTGAAYLVGFTTHQVSLTIRERKKGSSGWGGEI
jgi:hypothetical protein